MLPAYSTLDIRRFTRSRRRQELGFQPGSRVSESAPHLGPCVGPACDVACGATSWLCTLHANSTASPQVRRPNASPPQPSAPGGDGQTALVKNHCCRSAAQEHIWNRSESPDPVLATNSESPNLCAKYEQPNVPQTWATRDALPPRPCAV